MRSKSKDVKLVRPNGQWSTSSRNGWWYMPSQIFVSKQFTRCQWSHTTSFSAQLLKMLLVPLMKKDFALILNLSVSDKYSWKNKMINSHWVTMITSIMNAMKVWQDSMANISTGKTSTSRSSIALWYAFSHCNQKYSVLMDIINS